MLNDSTHNARPAPMSSDALFKAKATLEVPEQVALEALQDKLEELADDLIVEIQVVVR